MEAISGEDSEDPLHHCYLTYVKDSKELESTAIYIRDIGIDDCMINDASIYVYTHAEIADSHKRSLTIVYIFVAILVFLGILLSIKLKFLTY